MLIYRRKYFLNVFYIYIVCVHIFRRKILYFTYIIAVFLFFFFNIISIYMGHVWLHFWKIEVNIMLNQSGDISEIQGNIEKKIM